MLSALLAFGCSKQTTQPMTESTGEAAYLFSTPGTGSLSSERDINELSKSCAFDFGPLDFELVNYSAVWPTPDSNLVVWYFGGLYPNDENIHDFIPGVTSLAVNAESDMVADVTLRKRGFDAANVSPLLFVYADSLNGALLAELGAGEEFGLESFDVPTGTTKLYFVFSPGDIDFTGNHADVNFDVNHVSLYLPE